MNSRYLGYADLTDAALETTVLTSADLTGADLTSTGLGEANLTNATYDSTTSWPTVEFWFITTCPDGTISDGNPSCGF